MYSIKNMPSASTVLSAYTTFTASAMLVRTLIKEVKTLANRIIPKPIQKMILSKLGVFVRNQVSPQILTLTIEGMSGFSVNQLYEASEIYLRTKIDDASFNKLKVSKSPKEKSLSLMINKGEKIIDEFEGIQLIWKMTSKDEKNDGPKTRMMELSFEKKYMAQVLSSYLPHVMESSNAVKEEKKAVMLYALGHFGRGRTGGSSWGSTNLDHPATFEKIAMEPSLKQALKDDLDRFVRRRNFYRRVGKAWKRGYLLYGPPGTGKSSLIAAMANYLKFNIYDLELANISSNSRLRNLLVSTSNRSILVIEDIDCTVELHDRQPNRIVSRNNGSQLTLSGLLNFIDGLWSSCGDERIIVFTTNHKDRLDPALLRPGRMDMHIHMSYCTPNGFRILALNYLEISDHDLFPEIDKLITEVEVTPAAIAEELMKSEDADTALEGLVKFLEKRKRKSVEDETEGGGKRKAREGIDVDDNFNVDGDDQCKAKKMRISVKDQLGLMPACLPGTFGA